MEYGKVSDTEDSRLISIARKNGMTGDTQPQNVTRSRTPSWSHQLFEHVLVLAVAGDEQAQLRRGFQRLGKAANGGRNILDGGQTRGNAAQHVAVLDLGTVGVPQIGHTVKFALRTIKIHTVVDFYNALRVKAALR